MDFEVFPGRPASVAYATSFYPPLTFRSLSETLCGSHRFQRHSCCRTARVPETGSLRLFFPSTLTGMGSPLNQGLPRPVGSVFRV
jgi:hypothetical protein